MTETGLQRLENLNLPQDGGTVEVRSAYDLTIEEQGSLGWEINKKLGANVTVVEKTDPELIAGISVSVGGTIIEGSLKHSIEEAARNVHRSAG
jgi:F-type H+-transporting ATPase subunit delta